ncbi:MAG: SDR family oxidoreductase [Mesorhizobium sp.]|uniref:SDR family NAD(P)-dependent oxidoreductase n=1 Tax=Mesorhizobium sp. TaxID=1871066 RepID=UPI000FE8D9BB|nr:SDR family NAD(P)-dependent oxidoreductase [Mesorhizobium sp.]RWJ39840.1 MAG: SDR family oxidoreductase [Mesorhizobium sp.]RWJ81433.1 MAG: SDR family oxidoreductase [Mesorhizobium sp.]TIR08916.1 MAG: SDR family oxidoreductase [Mesorhizobium sp.]
MERRLQGKTAVVTGGANGIGRACCERLAVEGADIVIADIAAADETVMDVKRTGGKAVAQRCDLSSLEDVARLRERVDASFGGCDVLVHNAGIYPNTPFEEITFDEWRKVMTVNIDSMFHLTKAFLPNMKSKGWGRIIAMSSTVFHSGIPGYCHYSASKAGLIGFMRSLASEVGQFGITANAIAPGLVRTGTTEARLETQWFDQTVEQQAIKRTGEPADLVGPLAFIASNDAAFVTGQTLLVDGGWRFV